MTEDKDKDKPKRRVMIPNRKTVERLEAKQEYEGRLRRVRDMLDSYDEDDEEEVSIEETNRALEDAGFDSQEIRSFARFLVAQEEKPFTLPVKSPEHYTAIRDEVRALTAKLLAAGANIWTVKQALEGRIEELTTRQHEERKYQTVDVNSGLQTSQTGEAAPNGEED